MEGLPAATESENVLIIVIDTVRYDRFLPHARHSITPNLDQIAANGVRFDNAWATSSWSLASHASIMTGLYPHESGAEWPTLRLLDTSQTLAEILSRQGYVTGAFSANASWVTNEHLGRGFVRFKAYIAENLFRRTTYGRIVSRLLWPAGLHPAGRGKTAQRVNEELIGFLDDYPDRPFFAYLCYMDVNRDFYRQRLNRPFWTRQSTLSKDIEAYDEGIRRLDAQVGALFNELERRGLLSSTVVVVTSDHGESFGTGLGGDHDPPGHGTSLYPEQTRVPLILAHRASVRPGQTVDLGVSLRQIVPTIVDMLDIPEINPRASPLPLDGDSRQPGQAILASLRYNDIDAQSVVKGDWLLVSDSSVKSGPELYDLSVDPRAQNNLAEHPRDLREYQPIIRDLSSHVRSVN